MVRNFHPERTDPRGLQKNQRALEALLERLFDRASGEELFVVLAGRAGGQTILQGLTVEGGVTLNDLEVDADFLVKALSGVVGLFVDGATGQVGVNTAAISAGTLLEVAGPIRMAAGASLVPAIYFTSTTPNANIGRFRYNLFPGVFAIRDDGAGVDKMTFTPTGVGVGVNPSVAFHVGGLARFNSNVAFFAAGSFGGGTGVLFLGNRTTAPASNPVGGVILYAHPVATGKSNLLVKNEAGETTRLTGVDARATADFVKDNTSSANVPGLIFHVEAGKTYSFVARCYFDADAAGGHKWGIGTSGTVSAAIVHVRSLCDATGAYVLSSRVTALSGATIGEAGCTAGYTEITGTATFSAAGQIYVSFAQQVASGQSFVKRGSTFHIREIT